VSFKFLRLRAREISCLFCPPGAARGPRRHGARGCRRTRRRRRRQRRSYAAASESAKQRQIQVPRRGWPGCPTRACPSQLATINKIVSGTLRGRLGLPERCGGDSDSDAGLRLVTRSPAAARGATATSQAGPRRVTARAGGRQSSGSLPRSRPPKKPRRPS
jgi:hypothetical protein